MKNANNCDRANHTEKTVTDTVMLKKSISFIFMLLIIASTLMAKNSSTSRTISFDAAWSFAKDDVKDAEAPNFNDSNWRIVNLPHDWSVEDLPNQSKGSVQGPFSKKSIGKAGTGWTVGGTAWYRKKFVTDKSENNAQVSIHFDGVYMNSDVWINGHHLGNHPYGYTPFYYDLTPYMKPVGQENVIAVSVKNEGRNSRWYSGSGIYRHVWLSYKAAVHVDTWGIFITTPEVSQEQAKIQVATKINNKLTTNGKFSLVTSIVDTNDKNVASSQKDIQVAGASSEETQTIVIAKPVLWSLDAPVLYKAVTEIKDGDKIVDRVETNFGIRSIVFDGKNGFSLNGKNLILKGGCIHHDNGPLGAATFDRAEERKIEILKKNGYNAIRLSHNPPSQQLLDACDRLGMLVLDEAFDTWIRPKSPEDDYNIYFNAWWKRDLDAMILRDRNHPSIIMWSIGNEIYEAPDQIGIELVKKLAAEARKLDTTRPITSATIFVPPYTVHPLIDYIPHLDNLDIEGYNYFLEEKSKYTTRDSATSHFCDIRHVEHPQKTFLASETYPYFALENYDKSEKCPYVIGSFKWTAFDYLGEAGVGKARLKLKSRPTLKGLIGMGTFFKDEWPIYTSYTGDFDLIGNKKLASYYQDVVWRQSPIEVFVHEPIPADMLELVSEWGFPDAFKSWTWPGQEGKKMQVLVYTRSKVVKLELNGKQIAEQTVAEGSITATFEIDYQPGTLVAKGYDNGKKTGTSTLTTTGKPVGIRLVPDRSTINADMNDLAYVSVEIVDAKGNVVPNVSDLEVSYQLSGNATLAAVGSGSPNDMSSFQQNHKKVFLGKGMVILRPNGTVGKIVLKAKAEGLKESSIEISSKQL